MALDEVFWASERELLLEILLPSLRSAALLGAEHAADDLVDAVGVGVDWTLVNERVATWAGTSSAELVSGITATTERFTQQAIAEWVASGQPLDTLIDVLEPSFGARRAEMIASTEVTRAFAAGNQAAWQESGAVAGMVWQTAADERVCPICGPLQGTDLALDSDDIPPAHPRCRCWVQPRVTAP